MARAPKHVAIEGVIGVGKTTLATRLSRAFGARLILEAFDENPFLPKFYRDPQAHALATQMFFLMARFRQQQGLVQGELFQPSRIVDYLFEKDRIFAELTLAAHELRLYEQLFAVLAPQVPNPDLVIYLRAEVDVLLERIRARGRPYERNMDPGYLSDLGAAYARFFACYEGAPVMTVDTDGVDLARDEQAVDAVIRAVRAGARGVEGSPATGARHGKLFEALDPTDLEG